MAKAKVHGPDAFRGFGFLRCGECNDSCLHVLYLDKIGDDDGRAFRCEQCGGTLTLEDARLTAVALAEDAAAWLRVVAWVETMPRVED